MACHRHARHPIACPAAACLARTDNDGKVTKKEFAEALPSLGFDNPDRAFADGIFDTIDFDKDGVINYEELGKALRQRSAATMLQSVSRGGKERKGGVVELVKQKKQKAAVTLQATARGGKVRKEQRAQEKAAVALQATARGSHARKEAQAVKQTRQAQAAAAVALQATARGGKVRKEQRAQATAAVALQATARGSKARKGGGRGPNRAEARVRGYAGTGEVPRG